MLINISVVIVCKNEAEVIGRTLHSLQGLTDDIVVFDNGSSDGTIDIIKQYPVRLHMGDWDGFGPTRQKATALAKYDWILALDADEAIDDELKRSVTSLDLNDSKKVYSIRRQNFLGTTHVRYGEWGHDKQNRLFNRNETGFDDAPVHEKLKLPAGIKIETLPGYIIHSTMKNLDEYARKMVQYAMLNAKKYHAQGKKSSWLKMRVSPAFSFINNYLFRFGFLDGHAGYICAKMTAWYTFLKYARLRELNRQSSIGNKH